MLENLFGTRKANQCRVQGVSIVSTPLKINKVLQLWNTFRHYLGKPSHNIISFELKCLILYYLQEITYKTIDEIDDTV